MNRKVGIAIGILSGGLLLAWLTWMAGSLPRSVGDWTLSRMSQIVRGIESYSDEFGSLPPQDYDSLFEALLGGNPRGIEFLDTQQQGDRSWGMDAWGIRYRIFTSSAGVLVWSAGEDQVFSDHPGNGDDLVVFRAPPTIGNE